MPELVAGERRSTGAGVGDGWVGEDEVVAGGALRELSPNGRSDLVGERDAPDDADTGIGEAGSPSRAAPASPRPSPERQAQAAVTNRTAVGVGGCLVAGMLNTSLDRGRAPAAAPPAPAAARLVRVTTPTKIQHQERDRSRSAGAAAAQRLGRRAARNDGLPAHAASPPLGPGSPRVRWRRWRARSTARSRSAVARSWRRWLRAWREAARVQGWQ